jgi:pyruvate dehydrogenase E1 component alpha subunit/2-oxoisovalerate dehydrogenase E1 component alpha subunit
VTYRIGAHSTSDDPTRYRTQEEVDAWMKRDPLNRLRRHLDHLGAWSEARETELERELNEEIGRAITVVESHGNPPRETLFDDVYATRPWHLDEERDELIRSPRAPVNH